MLFLLVVDWVLPTTTEGARTGPKVQALASMAKLTCLNIQKHKTTCKITRINNVSTNPITLENEALEDAFSFTYLDSVISTDGGSEQDAQT